MKTPQLHGRSRDRNEKRARSTRSKESKKARGTKARKAPLSSRLGQEGQLVFHSQLLANVNDAVLGTGPKHRITYWNAAAERLYGYTADQVLGRLAREVVKMELTAAQRSAYARELEATGRLQFESAQYDRRGNRLLIQSTCSTLRACDRRVLGYVWVNRDVTVQRRAEEQLRRQAELLDLTHDAILVRDLESRITFWNRAAESLYGWTRAEAVGQPLQQLLHTRFTQPLAEIEAEIKQTGRWEGELVHTTRAGRPIQVASRWSLQRDAQGEPVAILQINTDISERKRREEEIHQLNADLEKRVSERTAELETANHKLKQEIAERLRIEDELREAEQEANDLIKYAPTAIYEADLKNPRLTRVNEAMCQLTGYTREELLTMAPFDILDPESQARFRATIGKTLSGERPDETLEYGIKTKDGRDEYVVLKTRLVLENETPVKAFVIAHSITERKRRELNAAFLDDIGQDLLLLQSPTEMMQALGNKAARYFKATRLVFAEVNPERDEMDILYDSHSPPSIQIDETRLLPEYVREELMRGEKAGRVLVVDDLITDSRFADRAPMLDEHGFRAQIIAPFLIDGRLRFIGALQHGEPHHWRPDEGELCRELGARLYPALQRARTEQALRESEERLRRAVSIETVGIIFFDLEGAITDANEAFLRMSGYSRADLEHGRVRWDLMTPPEFMPSSLSAIEELVTKGETIPYEKEYIRKDGSRWWGLFAAKRLTEKELVEFILDITERKRSDKALRQSEARFKSLYQSLPYLALVFQAREDELVMTDYNQAAVPYTRGGIAGMVGHTARELYAARPETLEHLERAYTEKTVLRREAPYRLLTTGEDRYLIQTFAYVPPDQVLIHVEDITERKQAEATLRESEERFRTVLENSLDAAYRFNLQTNRYDYMSPAIEHIAGFSAEELSHLNANEILERIHSDDRALVQKMMEEILAGTTATGTIEFRFLGKDGQYRWLSDNVSVLRDASGRPLYQVGIIRDMTERRQTEERVTALNRDLERHSVELATTNQELESFSYSVSHDLRTPLATVDGLSRLLQQEYGASLPEPAQRYLGLVRTGTRQMDVLITSLLGLARLSRHALQKQPVNMTALVGEALATLQEETARPDLTIAVLDLAAAVADPVLLKQVWINLIANACKFTRKREHARIEVGSRQWAVGNGQPSAGSEPNSPTNDHYPQTTVYYVRDNGVGFDMEQADRLFGVFQRLHDEDEYEGTGVGLATVARIIHRHGGRVWAEGEVGKGATFCFTLAS